MALFRLALRAPVQVPAVDVRFGRAAVLAVVGRSSPLRRRWWWRWCPACGATGGCAAAAPRLLVAARALLLLLVLVCLARPMLVLRAVVPQESFVGVLVDDSRSMTIADAPEGGPRRGRAGPARRRGRRSAGRAGRALQGAAVLLRRRPAAGSTAGGAALRRAARAGSGARWCAAPTSSTRCRSRAWW